jgi:hypothetical protein
VARLVRKVEFLTRSTPLVRDHRPPPAANEVAAVVARTRAVLPVKVTRERVLVRVFRYAPPPRAPAAHHPVAEAELFRKVVLVSNTLADDDATCKPPPCADKRPARSPKSRRQTIASLYMYIYKDIKKLSTFHVT